MSQHPESHFETIEDADDYLTLLAQKVEESREHVLSELSELRQGSRRADALLLVAYKLERLAHHSQSSRKLLNDLRHLKRLLAEPVPVRRRKAG